MRNRFDDRCDRCDCQMNLLDRTTKTRICKGLINTDFGGDHGGEHCKFYKPKKKKAADCLQQPTAKEKYRTFIIDGIVEDVKKGKYHDYKYQY